MQKVFCIVIVFFGVLASFDIAGQDFKSGDWFVYKSIEDMQIANVRNESGAVTGVVCLVSANSCFAYIATETTCEPKGKYPFMINSPTGAHTLMGTCLTAPWAEKEKPAFLYSFDEFASTIAAYESGGTVGFVTPMKNGEFRVFRFSTVGATAAIKAARERPAVPAKKSKPAEVL